MFGRKKVQEPVFEPVEKAPPKPRPDHEVELRAKWDDDKAEWEYQLYKVETGRPGFFAGPVDANEWYWSKQATSFDEAWAKRQAIHYKVKIIYEEAK